MTDAPGRRRRLSPQERRSSIVGAAAAAFDASGPDEVVVSGIAASAGVSEALVYHYFASKADLYGAAVAARLAALEDAMAAALAQLHEHQSSRDRVRTCLLAQLDHAAEHPAPWAHTLDAIPGEPRPAAEARTATRERHLALLASFLHADSRPQRHYALVGHITHVGGLIREWARRGCATTERHAVVDVALGALEGALGDWGR